MSDKPKLDFGPTKKDHGWFYYVWNWKTYAFYLLLVIVMVLAFLDQGLAGPIIAVPIMYGLKFLGKIF